MSKLIPLQDRVLIKPLTVESKSTAGILLSAEINNNYLHGEVLAVGPGKQKASGDYLPMNILVGDKVVYGKVASTIEDMQDGEKVYLVPQDAIVAMIGE
jgi:chaperonin GroES